MTIATDTRDCVNRCEYTHTCKLLYVMNKPTGKKHACGVLRLWRKGFLADLRRRNVTGVEGGILAKAVLAQAAVIFVCLEWRWVGLKEQMKNKSLG